MYQPVLGKLRKQVLLWCPAKAVKIGHCGGLSGIKQALLLTFCLYEGGRLEAAVAKKKIPMLR